MGFYYETRSKVKKRWINEAKKNNLTIQTLGLDSLATFTIKSKNSQKYKTFITQEMLKKKILQLIQYIYQLNIRTKF